MPEKNIIGRNIVRSKENVKRKQTGRTEKFPEMSTIPYILYRDKNKKVKEMDQQTLRQPKPQSDKKVLPFVTTNNPRNPDVNPVFYV